MNIIRLRAEGIGFLRRLVRRRYISYEGVVLEMDYHNWSPLMLRRVAAGLYESQERLMVHKLLEPQDRVLEIGGGIGLIAVLSARIVGQNNVFVYEANPEIVERASETFRLNGENISISHAAVVGKAHGEGTVTFFLSPNFWSSSLIEDEESHLKTEVPAVELDTLLRQHSPTVIIADVEGAEYEIFTTTDLKGVRKMIIELHTRKVGSQRVSDLILHLLKLGFRYELKQSMGEVVYFAR